jgi:hypothetical protein
MACTRPFCARIVPTRQGSGDGGDKALDDADHVVVDCERGAGRDRAVASARHDYLVGAASEAIDNRQSGRGRRPEAGAGAASLTSMPRPERVAEEARRLFGA